MSIVIVQEPLTSKLDQANAPIEVCAADGRVLGYFTPAKPQKRHLQPPATEEELERRFRTGGGRSLQQIKADWEKRS
jgi:hypothetical protein